MPLLLEWKEEIDFSCACVAETVLLFLIVVAITKISVYIVVAVMCQSRQVIVISLGCCWYSGCFHHSLG